MVTEELVNKGENVVTVGLDDTTQAAGHKSYDVKADHITISGPVVPRKQWQLDTQRISVIQELMVLQYMN